MVRRETKIMQTIEQCKEKYEHYKASALKLDMSRGKPAVDQTRPFPRTAGFARAG